MIFKKPPFGGFYFGVFFKKVIPFQTMFYELNQLQ